jgi:hypothetical protein
MEDENMGLKIKGTVLAAGEWHRTEESVQTT